MTATKIYKEEKIAQRIKLVIRTSYIIGNQYLPPCGADKVLLVETNLSQFALEFRRKCAEES